MTIAKRLARPARGRAGGQVGAQTHRANAAGLTASTAAQGRQTTTSKTPAGAAWVY